MDTFYAWGSDWNGGGILNSATFLLIGIVSIGYTRGLSFIIILTLVCSVIQLLQRALITLYRNKRESDLLWEIGSADTMILSYKGRADIRGRHRKVITYKGEEIPKSALVVVVGMDGMKPVVERI